MYENSKVRALSLKLKITWLAVVACCSAHVTFAEEQMQGAATGQMQESEPADELRFDVFEYQVDGNSVLKNGDIEKAVYPFMGEHKTI